MIRPTGFVLALSAGILACATDDAAEDPRDEDVISDGKADAFGIAEGSAEAQGILELVNTAPAATLRAEVKLGAVVTDELIAHRAGPDGIDDTSDDDLFDDLVELDHVPFVGSTTFAKLLDFARANGFIVAADPDDPFDPASCDGPPMPLSEIDQRLGTLGLYPSPMCLCSRCARRPARMSRPAHRQTAPTGSRCP